MGRKKICLIVCGPLPDFPLGKLDSWLRQVPELNIIADVEPMLVFDRPSADVSPAIWRTLSAEIHQRLNRYAGFVVVHGVDNLLYTAAAVSFLIQNLTRPVVFTGSGMLWSAGGDVEMRANLISAIQLSTAAFTEVGLMFGNRLLRANQATALTHESVGSFYAPPQALLGRIDFSARIFETAIVKNRGAARLATQLSENVELLHWTPAHANAVTLPQPAKRDGLIIDAGAYHVLPETLVRFAAEAAAKTPVVIWAPKITTPAPTQNQLLIVTDMTWPTTLTKYLWALGQTKNVKQLKALMNRNFAGELNKT